MNKNSKSPNYRVILNVLYIVISLAVMTIFLFASTPKSDGVVGLISLAMWGTVLAALIAVVLIVLSVMRHKK